MGGNEQIFMFLVEAKNSPAEITALLENGLLETVTWFTLNQVCRCKEFIRVSKMWSTCGREQFEKSGQKLHEDYKIHILGAKQWGTWGEGKPIF